MTKKQQTLPGVPKGKYLNRAQKLAQMFKRRKRVTFWEMIGAGIGKPTNAVYEARTKLGMDIVCERVGRKSYYTLAV